MNRCVIIILVYGDSDSAIELVRNVKDWNVFEKIVLVDNCSPDDSYEKLQFLQSDYIHVIKTEKNDGIARGNNFGAKYAKEICPDVDYYLFSNPDVIVPQKECITDVIRFMDKNSDFAGACPMELTKEGDNARDFAWKMPDYKNTVLSVMPIHTKLFQHRKNFLWFYDVDKAVKKKVFIADVIISCFIVVRRTAFEEIGGFYKRTFLYNEENFLAYKFREEGYRMAVLMKHPIMHLGCTSMSTVSSNWEWKGKLLFDSSMIYLEDCLQTSKIGLLFYKLVYKVGVMEIKIFRKLTGRN